MKYLLAMLFSFCVANVQAKEYLSVGSTFYKSDVRTAAAGLRLLGWDFGTTVIQKGKGKHGDIPAGIKRYHLAKVKPLSKYGLMRAGISKIKSKHPDVGEWNFHVGLGYRVSKSFELWYTHDSSFKVNYPNAGIDQVSLVMFF